MGDIEDNREHRDPAKTPAVPIDELVRVTNERLAAGNDEGQRRAWLFALFDQLDDIVEATKNNPEPLAAALNTILRNSSPIIGKSATADAGNHCVRTTRTHYFSSFSNFSSAFNSESTWPLARTL